MVGGEFVRRILGEAARRAVLLVIAVLILAVVIQLLCAAAVVALDLILPMWAAITITAIAALAVATVLLALALRQPADARSATRRKHTQPQEQAFELGETAGAAMRHRPKTMLAVATLVGLVLGYDPSLRRDILDLLRNRPEQ